MAIHQCWCGIISAFVGSEVSMSLPWLFRLLGLGIPSTMMMVSGLTGMIGASFASLKVNPRHMSAVVSLDKAHEIG